MHKKKILSVIAHDGYRDEEFLIPKKIFEDNGYNVDVVSDKIGIATGSLGNTYNINKTIVDIIDIDEYCAITIAGGIGSKYYLWNNKNLHELINMFFKSNKIVAAICISPVVLNFAKILDNKNVTYFKNDKLASDIMKFSKCNIIDSDVVIDNNIITANGPNSSTKYGESIIKAINNK